MAAALGHMGDPAVILACVSITPSCSVLARWCPRSRFWGLGRLPTHITPEESASAHRRGEQPMFQSLNSASA
jgi:hypothetical protein